MIIVPLEKEDNQQQQQQEDIREMDSLCSEEQLTSIERIERFCQSDNIMERLVGDRR